MFGQNQGYLLEAASFLIKGKRYDSIEIKKFPPPYLIFEILSKEKCVTRGIHILSLKHKSVIRIGRGHDADVRISDISVSRLHALLRLEKNELYLEDQDSKFGTLALCREPLYLDSKKPSLSVQVGRSVLCFTIKKITKKQAKSCGCLYQIVSIYHLT